MNAQTQPAALAAFPLNINLTDFIDEFGDELLESLNRSNPGLYRLRQRSPPVGGCSQSGRWRGQPCS